MLRDMLLMYADEADREQNRRQKFFVYGAIFVEVARAWALHRAVDQIRVANGFAPADCLKFATNSRPEQVTREGHTAAKNAILNAAFDHGVVFCSYVMLHELARNQGHEELVQWGANTLLGKFNEYCATHPAGHGMVMFDRMPIAHEHRYFKEKFTIGLTLQGGRTSRLDRVISYASTCDSASHLSSVTDIVLGSFRYCVNEPGRDIAGRAMLPLVARLMWHQLQNGRKMVGERGLVVRPRRITEQRHQDEYDALRARLNAYLVQRA